jgi:uncharacterized membrane protein
MAGDHHQHAAAVSAPIARVLWIAVGAWAAVTLIGVIALWPGSRQVGNPELQEVRVNGTVEAVDVGPCTGTTVEQLIECRFLTVRLTSGVAVSTTTVLELGIGSDGVRQPGLDDDIVLFEQRFDDGTANYVFADYQRGRSVTWLFIFFGVAVVGLGRLKGLGALAGLAVSVAVLLLFMVPALLEGSNPTAVAVVAASIIAIAALYMAHGVNDTTNVALLSTLAALMLTGLLAWVFIRVTSLTGFTDESSFFLEALGRSIDPRGLLLAGVVVGSLGVLDDVTVTQVSAVAALREAQPDLSARQLYSRALTVGRDHISSTVNTLFLAYAGASLPLLLLFSETGQSVGGAAMSEQVAVEIVRTLVGSIGLVASVPIATALAAAVVTGGTVRR